MVYVIVYKCELLELTEYLLMIVFMAISVMKSFMGKYINKYNYFTNYA